MLWVLTNVLTTVLTEFEIQLRNHWACVCRPVVSRKPISYVQQMQLKTVSEFLP